MVLGGGIVYRLGVAGIRWIDFAASAGCLP